ncbi:cytochrome P450 [Microbispora sp. ZYX-F-249]|uniref:Cytochrome P450 n=1 Tax=Microbispora maris TaxID=3144104 RepID=A0ABV0ALF1_9ACTN
MTDTAPNPATIRLGRENAFDPPADHLRWEDGDRVRPLRYADGHVGWLVTGYAAARTVLADPRFSGDPALLHPPTDERGIDDVLADIPGLLTIAQPPGHARFRRRLAGPLTLRRMRRLEPRIRQITTERLDALQRLGPPADIVREFAVPVPALVLCELLGVPYRDHSGFERSATVLLGLDSTPDQVREAMRDLLAYTRDLVIRRRDDPADDIVSVLAGGGERDRLSVEEAAAIAMFLLVAGHEATADMLALGTFALLRHPDQLAALRADPSLAAGATEELLRYLSVVRIGPVRAACADVELDGRLIGAGQSVTLSLAAANRDPARFPAPGTLDIRRDAGGQLSFGYGPHQCLGQQLARLEMTVALPALLTRLPRLRLAVAADEVPVRTGTAFHGLERLPVTW